MRIYVSSACVQARYIGEAVERLAREGYRRIELSGGTEPYSEMRKDLLELQGQYGLSYLCHNYFPPPPDPFVLNLASLDREIRQKSIEHLKRALDLSKELRADRFAFHAGFMLDIPVNSVGLSLEEAPLFEEEASYGAFSEGCEEIKEYAEDLDLDLYIENNVITPENHRRFGRNPFFLTRASDHDILHARTGLPLLLDSGHMKVSCRALGLEFENEFLKLEDRTDYFHISDNDGSADSNGPLLRNTSMFELLERIDTRDKVFTLEVYTGMDDLRVSFLNLESLEAASL